MVDRFNCWVNHNQWASLASQKINITVLLDFLKLVLEKIKNNVFNNIEFECENWFVYTKIVNVVIIYNNTSL